LWEDISTYFYHSIPHFLTSHLTRFFSLFLFNNCSANRVENLCYLEKIRSRVLTLCSNAVYVGKYLSGFNLYVCGTGTTSWVLTEDYKVKSYITCRKTIKFKLIKSVDPAGSAAGAEDVSNSSGSNKK
jgi:hypothetical protein